MSNPTAATSDPAFDMMLNDLTHAESNLYSAYDKAVAPALRAEIKRILDRTRTLLEKLREHH